MLPSVNSRNIQQENKQMEEKEIPNIFRDPSPPIFKEIKIRHRPTNVKMMQLRIKQPIYTGKSQENNNIKPNNQIKLSKPSHYIFPSYLHITEVASPHLLAHSIIFSDDDLEETVEEKAPNLQQELKESYPNLSKIKTLRHPNQFFLDLLHLSINLYDYEYINLASNFIRYRNRAITKTRCHINSQNIITKNRNSYFLIPRLLACLFYNQKEETDDSFNTKISKFSSQYDKYSSSSTKFLDITQYLARQVSEFTDRRKPLPYIPKLPNYKIDPIITDAPHYTKSYVRYPTPPQSTAFGSFLFNSEYVSISTGNEGENNGDYPDEDFIKEYRINLDNYFLNSAAIPYIQTAGSTLMRAYSLLMCDPRPQFNLFPGYLVYSISLIYQESTRKILNLMSKDYDAVLPEIAQTILNAIHKTNEMTPQWDFYLMTRNVVFSSKHVLKYDQEGKSNSVKILNELSMDNCFTLTIRREELNVILFLRAYLEEALSNSSYKSFFKLFRKIGEIELLIIRPFAAGLLMIPAFVKLFRELDDEFENRMHDDLFLHGKDRFILKISEIVAGCKKTVYDHFIIRNDVPLSMRMFLEYAITIKTAKKEVFPQKLTFTNFPGFKLISELESFSSILTSFLISMDFKALKNLFKAYTANRNINYQLEAAKILQGRNIIGITKTKDFHFDGNFDALNDEVNEQFEIQYKFRKIVPSYLPQLSSSFLFAFGSENANENDAQIIEGQNRSVETSIPPSETEMTADSNDEETQSGD